MVYLEFTDVKGRSVYLRKDLIAGVRAAVFGSGTEIILTRTEVDSVIVKETPEEIKTKIKRSGDTII